MFACIIIIIIIIIITCSIFALCVDPFVRCLLSKIPRGLKPSLFADHIAAVCHNMLEALPVMMKCFCILELAAGLALKPCKCIIVPLCGLTYEKPNDAQAMHAAKPFFSGFGK